MLEDVRAAYAAGQEFIVQYGQWPAYRLFVEQKDGEDDCHKSARHFALECMNQEMVKHGHVWSVFDLDLLDLNARIGKTLSKGVHPQKRLDDARARYAQIVERNQQNTLMGLVDMKSVDQQMASLVADVAKFEADPEREDRVEIFLDLWYLKKVSP